MGYESTSARDVQMPFHQFINQQDPRLFGSSFRKSKTLSFSVCVNSCKYTQKAPHDDFSLVSEQNNGLFSRHIPLSYTIEFPTAGSLFTLVNTNTDFQKVTRLTPESEYLYQSGSFAQLPLFSEDTPVQQLDFSGDICSEDQRLNSKAKWANKALAEIPKAFDFIYTKGEGGSPIAKANGRQDQSSDVRAHISHRDEFITNQSNRPAQNHHHRKPSTTTNKNFNSPNNSVKKNYKLDPHLNTEKICPDICPSFVFSQFQPFICKDGSGAKALEQSEALNRALAVLDLTIACETYKAGLMYVAPGQVHLEDILGNTHGSSFYNSFIQFLGEIVLLKDSCFFTGGLDKTKNLDGIYSLLWRDHVSQIMFHVTTFMPNLPSDPTFVNKTRHIGNDYIIIIWHDWDDAKCGNDTLAGHFNLVTIVIHSLNNGWYRISVQSKNQIYQPASFLSPQLVHGEDQLAHFVRILVINAHPLCKWNMMNQKKIDVVSHYEERLRQIDQIGQRLAVKNVDDLDQVFLH
ncbi:uncharacterized protein LOC126316974 [Schistocerca gregaria]|uniref:uncharacterized protein LOC126316974 n=1 Tax=Schistocerca gregaria TaxID=7010 RepID=UPI00211E3926|nr:uncharacterized protein LOC126316974 [Schistocerca gregaria]